MNSNDYVRMTSSMKFISLYWNLGYEEKTRDHFIKSYNGYKVEINASKATINFNGGVSVVNGEFKLDNYKSFVILEVVDRLLGLGYSPYKIIIDLDNEFDVYVSNIYIKCFEWGNMIVPEEVSKSDKYYQVFYESRLVSGCVETNYIVYKNSERFNDGLFVKNGEEVSLFNTPNIKGNKDFVIEGTTVTKYLGHESKVVVPEGVTTLSSGLFWDNQEIEEVILPDSLKILGGDMFYKCSNLKKVIIPKNVVSMGDNPFAGCYKLELENKSDYFVFENDVLFNKNKSKIIYYKIQSSRRSLSIPESVSVIGKHSFYKSNLELVEIPSSVHRFENNPFSNSKNLHLKCESKEYKVIDDVIYKSNMSSVVGALTSIKSDNLILKEVKTIDKNSFYNCKGIKKITLPKTLKTISYNPFVGCTNIEFESKSPCFKTIAGILYDETLKKLICYPAKKAIGEVSLPQSVTTLERGAFSGCDKMTSIKLRNVSIIGKSCFTRCSNLKEVYLSDLVSYVGVWCFAHCENLKRVSYHKSCIVDDMAFLNTECEIIEREERENYLVESDNLFTLNSMKNNYKGKIKSILIDPPYNSNISYIGYKDSYQGESYLKFMDDRLRIAYDLLSKDGFLVINIDYGMVGQLNSLCKNIFGKSLVSIHRWKKINKYFDVNREELNPNKKKIDYEYIIICRKSSDSKLNKIHQPYLENEILKERISEVPEMFDFFGTTSSAKDEIKEIFGRRDYFSTPKPVKLIEELIRATSSEDSIVMDFFAGSGTLAHAVINLNKEDNGRRKFILITNNESNICKEVTKKRLDILKANYTFLD